MKCNFSTRVTTCCNMRLVFHLIFTPYARTVPFCYPTQSFRRISALQPWGCQAGSSFPVPLSVLGEECAETANACAVSQTGRYDWEFVRAFD